MPLLSRTHILAVRRAGILFFLNAALLVVGTLARSAPAAEPVQAGASHRGVVPSGPYQIFPENRFSNGVYLDGTLLLSLPGETLLSAAQIAPGGRLIYLARGPDGKRQVGVRVLTEDAQPRLTEPAKGYQYVTAGFDGQGFKKLYRVTDNAVVDLLPASKTADGLTIGPKGIVFFHIASSPSSPAPLTGELPPPNSFGIRLHWLNLETGALRHLGRTIYNSAPILKLTWLEDGRVEYALADGKTEALSAADFK